MTKVNDNNIGGILLGMCAGIIIGATAAYLLTPIVEPKVAPVAEKAKQKVQDVVDQIDKKIKRAKNECCCCEGCDLDDITEIVAEADGSEA